jgi:phosphoribosylcarboxyaminoimidazole (NCAIR) mutase
MNQEPIYQGICLSGDPEAAIRKLQDATLAGLAVHLAAAGLCSGVPGLVAGMIDLEIVARWMADQTTAGAVGEGALS